MNNPDSCPHCGEGLTARNILHEGIEEVHFRCNTSYRNGRVHCRTVYCYEREIAELKGWKEEQMAVSSQLKLQEIGKEIGCLLGADISPLVLPFIQRLKQRVKGFELLVELIHGQASKPSANWSDAIDTLEYIAAQTGQDGVKAKD